jgi:hypothetical protein
VGVFNPDQKDTDVDTVGDACDKCPDIATTPPGGPCPGVSSTVPLSTTVYPGEDIILKATVLNDTGQIIETIRPDCFTTTIAMTNDSTGQTLDLPCRVPVPYDIPGDKVIIYPKGSTQNPTGTFEVTCNLSKMFDAADLTPGTFTVQATYRNYLTDPDVVDGVCTTGNDDCHYLWRGTIPSGTGTVTIESGPPVITVPVTFEPAAWNIAWATGTGQVVKAIINLQNTDESLAIVDGSIKLNGSAYPLYNDLEAGVLTLEFDGSQAVNSLGTPVPGMYFPTVDGLYTASGRTYHFTGNGPVTMLQADPILIVQVDRHIVGTGTTPNPRKEPIVGVPVRLYSKAPGSCVASKGISWQNYPAIWADDGCGHEFTAQISSNGAGQAIFSIVPPGDYVAIGKATVPRPEDPTGPPETLYIGVSVGQLPGDTVVTKYLQVIQNYKNKNVPAKYRKLTGSDLLIIEPEYVEWSDRSEPYPFVFESIGEWSVMTSVTPPEGFVADPPRLSTDVISELKALQFTIVDIGSKWVPTKVKYTIKHKKKVHTIESSVGVKLTPELAKSKGLTVYGQKKKK